MKIFWVIDPLCIWRSLLLEFIDLPSHTLFGHTSKDFFFLRFFSKWRRRRRTQYGYYWWIVLILVAFLKILWTNVKNLISRLIVKFQRGWSLLKSYWSEKSGLLNYRYILHNSFCCSNSVLLWWEIWSFKFFSLWFKFQPILPMLML